MPKRPLPAYEGEEPYVFVSYSHEDKDVYSEIRWLQDQGFNIWWDEGISPGSDWSQMLAEAIEGCSLFLLFVSPSAIASDNCHREVTFALDTKRAFLAVHIALTDLPGGWKLNIGDRQALFREELTLDNYRNRMTEGVQKHVAQTDHNEDLADTQRARLAKSSWPRVLGAVVLLAGGGFALNAYLEVKVIADNQKWANEHIPRIEHLVGEWQFAEAYALVGQLQDRVPDRPEIPDLLSRASNTLEILTEPEGAEVDYRSYDDANDNWHTLGKSPLSAQVPRGTKTWRFTKDGYEPQLLTARSNPSGFFGPVQLQSLGSTPESMVFVQGGLISTPGSTDQIVPSFYIDRYEVSNSDYQIFVDADAYSDSSLWTDMDFIQEGRRLTDTEAMEIFVDSTGRPGPAGWILGQYIEGRDQWPVVGISWYEAVAYARFVGKALPTAAHWSTAAFDRNAFGHFLFDAFIDSSNLESEQIAPVGSSRAKSRVDAEDLFGNVREWGLNATDSGRVILGASWKQYAAMGWLLDSAPPMDRSEINGIRLGLYESDANLEDDIAQGADAFEKPPVPDETYELLVDDLESSLVDLDVTETVQQSVENHNWTWETASVVVPDNEVMKIHVFVPKSAKRPYQVVLYAPGAGSFHREKFTGLDPGLDPRTVVATGRAVVFPEYQYTFSRRHYEEGDFPSWAESDRQDMVARRRETAVTIDYVSSRKDMDASRIAYLAFSESASWFVPVLAVEDRIKTAVLVSGGFEPRRASHAIADGNNYFSRINLPVLMINGRYDGVYPYETSQLALFNGLGTPDGHKRHVLLEGGHGFIPHNEVMATVADWLDEYLGTVN